MTPTTPRGGIYGFSMNTPETTRAARVVRDVIAGIDPVVLRRIRLRANLCDDPQAMADYLRTTVPDDLFKDGWDATEVGGFVFRVLCETFPGVTVTKGDVDYAYHVAVCVRITLTAAGLPVDQKLFSSTITAVLKNAAATR